MRAGTLPGFEREMPGCVT